MATTAGSRPAAIPVQAQSAGQTLSPSVGRAFSPAQKHRPGAKARPPATPEKWAPGDKTARDREAIILANLGLVSFVVSRLREHADHGAWDREDVFAYGVLGLIQAVDSYDPAKGASFASFALIRIRGSILDFKRRMDLLPRSIRRNAAVLDKQRMELVGDLGRWPTREELAQRHGGPVTEIESLGADGATTLVYLDQARRIQMNGKPTWEPYDPDIEPPDEALEAAFVNKVVADSVLTLSGRDRDLIEMRYVQSLTLREIAQRLKVTQSRVSQLNKRLLAQLRSRISSELDLAS
jgi:RNA polymerase sigma factor FliA